MKTTETEKSDVKTTRMKDGAENKGSMNGDVSRSAETMSGGYGRFALMMAISFVIMYAVMFLNVADFTTFI